MTQNNAELRYERRGAGAWLTLNRPDQLNSLTPALLDALDEAITRATEDKDVFAVVLTGAGRAFCAGADLSFLHRLPEADRQQETIRFLWRATTVMSRLEAMPKPVIAAVNGIACAGGLELILCCDLVLAAQDAKVGDAHVNFGLLPGGGGSVRLPKKIGITRAKYLFYTGDLVPASDPALAGLFNRTMPREDLETSCGELVAKLATKSSLALRRMKALADDGLEQPADVALRNEQTVGELHFHSHDVKEGLAAFSEKRKPRYEGR